MDSWGICSPLLHAAVLSNWKTAVTALANPTHHFYCFYVMVFHLDHSPSLALAAKRHFVYVTISQRHRWLGGVFRWHDRHPHCDLCTGIFIDPNVDIPALSSGWAS